MTDPRPAGALPQGAGRNDASAVSELYARSRRRRVNPNRCARCGRQRPNGARWDEPLCYDCRPTCEQCGGPAPRDAGYMHRLRCLVLCDECARQAGFDPEEA